MAYAFLHDALLAEKTLKPGEFEIYNPVHQAAEYMVLDSQCL